MVASACSHITSLLLWYTGAAPKEKGGFLEVLSLGPPKPVPETRRKQRPSSGSAEKGRVSRGNGRGQTRQQEEAGQRKEQHGKTASGSKRRKM